MKRVACISALVLLASCLPKDTRPPPGLVVISVEAAAFIKKINGPVSRPIGPPLGTYR